MRQKLRYTPPWFGQAALRGPERTTPCPRQASPPQGEPDPRSPGVLVDASLWLGVE